MILWLLFLGMILWLLALGMVLRLLALGNVPLATALDAVFLESPAAGGLPANGSCYWRDATGEKVMLLPSFTAFSQLLVHLCCTQQLFSSEHEDDCCCLGRS